MPLFVYGTLMAGEENYGELRGSPLVREALTEPRYELLDLGAYPGLREGGAISVVGEVYEVDRNTLAQLDLFEGHPGLFRRSSVRLLSGEMAIAYLFVGGGDDLPEATPRIASGSWRAHRAGG
jgi:gamma-glutamylaminecyclotransferase